ncbi:EF-hand domain-containing protein [Altererythrobacter fulvus]|uniref:EF-hand domain-containing protein n=1 Tax=Caenibius fulvus TaxID=2126012 RepID=UPI0030162931
MRGYLALFGTALAVLAASQPVGAQGVSYGGEPSRIERGRSGPRMDEPIARKKFDQAVEKVFRSGDTDRDGSITLAEFNAAIEGRKAAMISQRFGAIDTDRNRQISLEEFSAWQRSLGSAVLAEGDGAGAERIALVAEQLPLDLGKDRDDEVLEDIIAPITATLIVEANSNYDGGVSLEELLAHEGALFDKADLNKDGWLTVDEIIALREASGKRDPRGPGGAPGGPGGPPPPPPGN